MATIRGFKRADRRPLYQQAQSEIIRQINEGILSPGEKLPREEELADILGVSRTTIRTALGNLESLGYIRRLHGAGTFVSGQRIMIDNPLDNVQPLHPTRTQNVGLSSHLENLSIKLIQADRELAEKVGVNEGDEVICVDRTVAIDQTPIAQLIDYIPVSVTSFQEIKDKFSDSVIGYFDGKVANPKLDWSRLEVSAVRSDETLCRLLQVTNGSVLMLLDETFFAADDQLVCWSLCYCLPETIKMHIDRRKVLWKE
jgi:GntR family transcriptional regulator